MAKVTLYKEYHCSDDCSQSSCPGHKAKLAYNSVSNLYEFDNGKGNQHFFEDSELDTFIQLLKGLSLKREDSLKV